MKLNEEIKNILAAEGEMDKKASLVLETVQKHVAEDVTAKVAEQMKPWVGMDPDKVRTMMQRIEQDEDAKLVAEGKTDEVIKRRTQRLEQDHASKMSALETRLKEQEQAMAQARERESRLVIDGQIRDAASKAGVHATALDDVLARGRSVFSLDDHGAMVARGQDGNLIMGKDGKSPLAPSAWLEGLRENAPHLWPTPQGGGAGGGARHINRNQGLNPEQKMISYFKG